MSTRAIRREIEEREESFINHSYSPLLYQATNRGTEKLCVKKNIPSECSLHFNLNLYFNLKSKLECIRHKGDPCARLRVPVNDSDGRNNIQADACIHKVSCLERDSGCVLYIE